MKLLVSALEPSANLHLEPILEKLRGVTLLGIYDERFGAPLYPSREFSVMGIFDVLPKIFKAKKAIKEMVALARDADVILLIDSPAFNIPLSKAIKTAYPQKKIIYYILPKVWAWNKARAKKVEAYCDVLASIFPFEDQFYPTSIYVGNPLLDEITACADTSAHHEGVAFLPGSRKGEIQRLMPIFRDVAKEITGKKWLVVPKFFKDRDLFELYGDLSDFEITYELGETLSKSDFAFVCSGTATLEAALIGTPFLLAYKANAFDYFIGSRVVTLTHVGLANIIMDFEGKRSVHEEYLQDAVTVENLLHAYKTFDKKGFEIKATELKRILQHGSVDKIISIINQKS